MLSGNSLRQTVHTHSPSSKIGISPLKGCGGTAGLEESNGSLPPGLWLTSPAGWLPRTGISYGTLRSVIDYGLPLPFYLINSNCHRALEIGKCMYGMQYHCSISTNLNQSRNAILSHRIVFIYCVLQNKDNTQLSAIILTVLVRFLEFLVRHLTQRSCKRVKSKTWPVFSVPPFCVIKLTTCFCSVRCKAVTNLAHWSSDTSRSRNASLLLYAALLSLQMSSYCLPVSTPRLRSCSNNPKSGSTKLAKSVFSLVMLAKILDPSSKISHATWQSYCIQCIRLCRPAFNR